MKQSPEHQKKKNNFDFLKNILSVRCDIVITYSGFQKNLHMSLVGNLSLSLSHMQLAVKYNQRVSLCFISLFSTVCVK